jgi:hypothetical protein
MLSAMAKVLLRAVSRVAPKKEMAPVPGRHYPQATALSRVHANEQGACRKSVFNVGGHLAASGTRSHAQRMSTRRLLPMRKAASTGTAGGA